MDPQPTLTLDVPADAVRRLLKQAGQGSTFELHPLPGGGNNRVFRVGTAGKSLLLKAYFRHPGDSRDRLGTDFAFTRFAWDQGIRQVPEPLGMDADQGLGLYEFIDGQPPRPGEVDRVAVDEALTFFHALNRHKSLASAHKLPDGSEACFRLADHLNCVDRRLTRLQQATPHTDLDRQANDFVRQEIVPRWQALRTRLDQDFVAAGLGLDDVLPVERRCLSPSDFGFHNALREASGHYRFIDFEYAGWDDRARMACDFFCQPAVPVPMEYWPHFLAELTESATERRRMELLLPVYRLKWLTILLNDFLDTGDQRRRFARPGQDPEQRKAEQLAKARAYLIV